MAPSPPVGLLFTAPARSNAFTGPLFLLLDRLDDPKPLARAAAHDFLVAALPTVRRLLDPLLGLVLDAGTKYAESGLVHASPDASLRMRAGRRTKVAKAARSSTSSWLQTAGPPVLLTDPRYDAGRVLYAVRRLLAMLQSAWLRAVRVL